MAANMWGKYWGPDGPARRRLRLRLRAADPQSAHPRVEKSVIGFLENRRTNFLQLQICRKYFTTAEFLFFH
jgi:hypothetical protein